ncbi:hypothetical protein BC835DRAFT_308764, partial [Cytidiella melzeri]
MAHVGDTAIKVLDASATFINPPPSTLFSPFSASSPPSPALRTLRIPSQASPTTAAITTTPGSSVYSLPRASSSFSSLSFKSSRSSMTTVVSTTRTDMLEQLFQRLEEESEIRALAHDEVALAPPSPPVPEPEAQEAVDVLSAIPSPLPEPATSATVRAAKERRRGSISISRFGGPTPEQNLSSESRLTSTRPSRSSSIVIQKPTFYQLNSTTDAHVGSADSLASDSADPTQDEEEAHMTTQMEKIQPPRSLSRAISRRLSRAKEIPLPSPSSTSTLVIDVAIEQATHESHSEDGGPRVTVTTATLRTQRSTPGLYDKAAAAGSAGWVSKAKGITSKFRRKSMAALIGPVPAR